MSTENQNATIGGYGYQTDDQQVATNPFVFGLNAGKTFLTKFEYIPNGGKDGTEQDALDIVFNINGTDRSYRLFPIAKAFLAGGGETTDPSTPEFQEALKDTNAKVTHILHSFMPSEAIQAGFSKPISSFKEFVQIAMSMLPTDFATRPLDIFMQYQWQLKGDQKRAFLEIPSKMKYGKWLCPAVPGNWTEQRADVASSIVTDPKKIQEATTRALWYTDDNSNEHPFSKNGWFMLSNFANQLTAGGSEASSANTTTGNKINSDGASKVSTW